MRAWFLLTLRKSRSVLRRVQLLWRMWTHLRVSLSSLLLELVICVAGVRVPSRDMAKDRIDLPMFGEKATVVDVVGAEEYVAVAGSSTPVRACAGFEYEGSTLRKVVRHALVQDSGRVVDNSGLSLYKFLSHLHSA